MKHPLVTTLTLLALFLATQLLGLSLVAQVMPVSVEEGEVVVSAPNTAVGPPPETSDFGALMLIITGVVIGTVLILVLMKLGALRLWRVWFFLAAGLTMTISLGVVFGDRWYLIAALLGFLLAAWKVFLPNQYVHNLTELLIYPGIAVLFYHILSIPVMLILLALISVYDVIAVLRSKHMIGMAEFQQESKVFAGLALPKMSGTKKPAKKAAAKKGGGRGGLAILGGGDVAFPLLFASVVMKSFVESGIVVSSALWLSSLVSLGAAIGLFGLFLASSAGRFYPAMPAVSVGAIAGWLVAVAITL